MVATAAGLSPIPLNEVILTAGSFLIALAYGTLLLGWKQGPTSAQAHPGGFPTPPQTHPPSQPQVPGAPAAPSPGEPTMQAPATPTLPSAPAPEVPKPPGRKLPSIQLPKPIAENKVPIALVTVGLILIIAAVAITFGPAAAFFWGVFIPGVLLLGFGGTLLFLRLYRREGPVVVELRRFCMHCGFQMSSTDVACPRCRRQPPSGVDTKVCPNCGAVIPTQAKFCRDCGAGQPATP